MSQRVSQGRQADLNFNVNRKILMFTGASGGHIMPALALRRYFPLAPIVAIRAGATEALLKDRENVVFIQPLAFKKLSIEALKDLFRAVLFALKFRSERILCFGSYLNAVGVFCARVSGAKLFFFEPNAVAGKGTALLSCFADKIFFMFQPRRKYKNSVLCKFPVSAGKPGRDEARSRLGLDPGKPLILILGGSQGSSFINDLVLRLLPRLGFAQIVHITGEADFMRVNAAYAAHKGKHLILPACHYMSILYSAADAAVSRAGAGTLADLAFYKIPSLLIPYPLAGAHQEKNADFFSDPPSAIIIRQAEVDEDKILTAIEDLVSDNFWKLKENLAKISLSDDGADLAAKLTA
ncbi:MAG: hypothetical protein COZ72_01875 [Elusimicrobia bacterium CG_4_8_14_3_um_filter_50_9]|nr:MAG: hypothetical protein COZ72_01875 [Elusimicrobia bacterium CG_4_8_14_3_um_filter_50_9]